MTNLERLEKEIRQKLPRLMEHNRVSGCMLLLPHILLSDVLEWLGIITVNSINTYCFDSLGVFITLNPSYTSYVDNSNILWELYKPHLRDQSQELIDYLASLI